MSSAGQSRGMLLGVGAGALLLVLLVGAALMGVTASGEFVAVAITAVDEVPPPTAAPEMTVTVGRAL